MFIELATVQYQQQDTRVSSCFRCPPFQTVYTVGKSEGQGSNISQQGAFSHCTPRRIRAMASDATERVKEQLARRRRAEEDEATARLLGAAEQLKEKAQGGIMSSKMTFGCSHQLAGQ